MSNLEIPDAAKVEVEPSVLAQSQRPILRTCAAFAALYYLVITLSHPFFEAGRALQVLISLSTVTSLASFLIWRRLRAPMGLPRMEALALILFALPLANVFIHQSFDFEPLKLVYFILLALAFATAAPSRRVGFGSALVAMICLFVMAQKIPSDDPVGEYVYLGVATLFAGVSISSLMRGAVLREIRARLAAEALNDALRREVTRNQALALEAQELAVAAKAANRAKTEFLATISHEIRTPLNGVLGMVQVMALDNLPDAQRERLGLVQSSAESLLDILNAVLDISRIEAGQMNLHPAQFLVSRFGETVHAIYAQLARQKGLDFSLDVAPEVAGPRMGDEVRLQQVLANLVANAIKFTETGSVRVRIAGDADTLTFEVADTGPGIPSDCQARIFDRFVQADGSNTRSRGGTGLGLAICRELVTLMGGEIGFDSSSEGTVFRVSVPVTAPGEAVLPVAVVGAAIGDQPGLVGRRILIVDDNPANRGVLQSLLEDLGADCGCAQDGLEAIAAWRTAPWDAILMDVHMPHLDGLQATKIIRGEEAAIDHWRTPILAVTASVLAHETAAYLEAGMDAVLPKPVMLPELAACLAEVMQRAPRPADVAHRA